MVLVICRRENFIFSKGIVIVGGGGEVESLLFGFDKVEIKEREIKIYILLEIMSKKCFYSDFKFLIF